MKLTIVLLTAAFLNVQASGLSQMVTLSGKNIPFEKLISKLKQQAGYVVFASKEIMESAKPVTIDAHEMALEKFLELALRDQPFVYSVKGKTIMLSKKLIALAVDLKSTASVLLLSPIRGRVLDAEGVPLAGATVTLKGGKVLGVTNAEGVFSVNVSVGDVLVISSVGFDATEYKISSAVVASSDQQSTPGTGVSLTITLKRKESQLDEVVINAGYYKVKDRERTGNISRVDSKEIEKQTVSNPLQAIQGRMAGVYIQQSTGMPGGGINIQIRGQNSLRKGLDGDINGNLPLYLVDGVPFNSTSLTSPSVGAAIAGGNPLIVIPPNDIQSVEILKDADATAIYGSRGANGVVLITTKHAKPGKTKLDIDINQSFGKVSHFMDLLNTAQYLTMRREGFTNDGIDPDPSSAPDLLVWDTTRYTDWQKELIGGTAHILNSNLGFSGGNEHTQFLLSGAYYRETTVFPGTNAFQRGSGRLFFRHQSPNNKFTTETSLNYSTSISDIPSTDFTSLAVTLSPDAPALYNTNGNLNWENSTWVNPLAVLKRKYKNTIDNFVANATLSYEVIPGLSVKSSLGYTSMNVEEINVNPISSFDPQYASVLEGYTNFGNGKLKTWIIEPMIDYTRKVGKGQFTVLIGSTFQQSTQQNKSFQAYGYTNDGLLEDIGAASTIIVDGNSQSLYKYTSAFMRLNYNWKGRYILNLTGRRDGSSRFALGNRFANFGAIGAAWIFSNENFAQKLSFLSFGKLRTSFGSTGSDAIGDYEYLETFSATRYPYNGATGLALNRLANPEYSWETNKKFEIGMELGFLKDRINFSASFYLNRSGQQLVGLPLPIMVGQSSVQFNLPATVENRGWEFQLFSTNIKKNKFEWTTTLNVTIPKNKLIAFPNLQDFPDYSSRYDVGNSIYTYKAYQSKGVNPQTGLYEIVDRNTDGQYSSTYDYIGLKKNTQTIFGGIGNTIKFRNFQLDFFFQLVKQTGVSYIGSFDAPGSMTNQPTIVLNRWHVGEEGNGIQRFSAIDPTSQVYLAYYYNTASDARIQDASFIRLKTASFSWYLPSKWMSKLGTEGSRVFINGQNLFTITNYIGLDPETQNSLALPPLQIISVGLHVSL